VLEPDVDLDFGEQVLGGVSSAQAVRFTNTGPGVADGIELLRDDDSGDFPLVNDGCSGRVLAIGVACDVVVEFRPRSAGERVSLLGAVAADSNCSPAAACSAGQRRPSPRPVG
jgi:hypothetical protein